MLNTLMAQTVHKVVKIDVHVVNVLPLSGAANLFPNIIFVSSLFTSRNQNRRKKERKIHFSFTAFQCGACTQSTTSIFN